MPDHEGIRQAVDIAHLIGQTVDLQEARRGYQALCPFHSERAPSFGIDPIVGVYHCFGCGASGDCFTWVQEKHGLSFAEAKAYLLERYGSAVRAG